VAGRQRREQEKDAVLEAHLENRFDDIPKGIIFFLGRVEWMQADKEEPAGRRVGSDSQVDDGLADGSDAEFFSTRATWKNSFLAPTEKRELLTSQGSCCLRLQL